MLHISEPAEDIAEQLHNSIIKRIIDRMMLRIGRGEEYLLTATDKWQIETLQEAGILLEDIQAEIARKTRLQEQEIKEAMEEAGVKAIDYDNDVYESVGLSPKPLEQSPNLIRIMQRNYIATMGEWKNFTRTIADASQQTFINACDIAYNHVITGSLSYTEAVKEAVNSIVSTGVEVIYPSGHKDTIETATLRCVRTGVSQASSQIGLARMDELDVDKVLISSHLGARPTHQVWQGKVFTKKQLYSTDEGMPAYGTVTGLCGANCRHNISPYIDGMSNPFEHFNSKENLEMYEKEQRQRLLERRIRDTKREVLGLKESMDKCQDEYTKSELERMYMRKSALLSKQNQAYNDYCIENDMKKLNDRISIARWDRKQAAAARGAAQRWNKEHGGSVARKPLSLTDLEKQFQDLTEGYSYDDFINDFETIENGFEGASVEEIAKAKKIAEKIESLRNIEKQPSVKMIKINTVDEAREALLSRIGFEHVDSISGINDELFIENTKQLVRLEDKFGAIHKSSLTRFDDVNHANAAACAESGYATPHIQNLSLCRSHYFDKAQMLQKEKKWVDSKWSVPCLESELPIVSLTHEYGHMIQNNLVAQAMREAGWDESNYFAFMDRKAKSKNAKFKWYIKQRKSVQDMCYNEIIAIAKEKNPLFVLEDNISGYGKTNKAEFFAEVFANSQLGKPNELGNAMNEWLERKGLIIK